VSELRHLIDSRYRYILFPLALLYWGVLFWRNLFYTIGFFVSKRLPCKVISVGNLASGGTGKTPAVIFLAQLLKSRGKKVTILSRGYGRKSTGTQLVSNGREAVSNWERVGDEPAMMASILPGIPIAVDENRFRGGTFLLEKFKPEYLILDDAFQHRSIVRDVDIVLINSQDTKADHKLLPYGLLREPWIHLRRADITFFTKANLKKPSAFLRSKARASRVPYFLSYVKTRNCLLDGTGKELPMSKIAGKQVIALSGVADSPGFIKTLVDHDLHPVKIISFKDHHVYTPDDIQLLAEQWKKHKAELIITTEKDLIKIKPLNTNGLPIFALPIRFEPSKKGLKALKQKLGI